MDIREVENGNIAYVIKEERIKIFDSAFEQCCVYSLFCRKPGVATYLTIEVLRVYRDGVEEADSFNIP